MGVIALDGHDLGRWSDGCLAVGKSDKLRHCAWPAHGARPAHGASGHRALNGVRINTILQCRQLECKECLG